MSYKATVFNVLIASPSDVSSERNIIKEVIYEWNAIHSQKMNIVLLPVGWETHSSPEMGAPPQEIINDQVLAKCDLLVGVFWTRIGTSTGEYASGTVEEIERHIESGKPAMLYFSSRPVPPDRLEQEQYTKLTAFKESCKNRSLYEEYDSVQDFKEKFNRHLMLKLNEHELFKVENSEVTLNIVDKSEPDIPPLMDEAKTLLKEASMDRNGIIMKLPFRGITLIKTNGKTMPQDDSPREMAKWTAAFEELIDNGLVKERGLKGEVFEVTNYGYEVAEKLPESNK